MVPWLLDVGFSPLWSGGWRVAVFLAFVFVRQRVFVAVVGVRVFWLLFLGGLFLVCAGLCRFDGGCRRGFLVLCSGYIRGVFCRDSGLVRDARGC